MKKIVLVWVTLLISTMAFSQSIDTLPPYLQFKTIPPFRIQLMDSIRWFSKSDLSEKKPTLIVYFSPDCGHCQQETEEIISNINALQKTQVVMVSSRGFSDVKNFYNYYLLNRFSNITLGIDPTHLVTNFYRVKFTPFSAFYKKGKLVKTYEKGINWDELKSLL